ncbi:MAG: chromate transporter [Kiritimatiellae bacterium]|nr:chromate transporter [Kiritimatiellia bacterium]
MALNDNTLQNEEEKKVPLWDLFLSFLKMGAVLIGGGYALLPLLENEITVKHKWAKSEEMTDLYALAQLLPGVIAVNTAMLVGNRLRGLAGNLIAALGLVFVPFILIVIYAITYSTMNNVEVVMKILDGVRPAAAGMIFAMGLKMLVKESKKRWACMFSLTVCAIVLFLNPPIVWMILSTVLLGLILNSVNIWKKRKEESC